MSSVLSQEITSFLFFDDQIFLGVPLYKLSCASLIAVTKPTWDHYCTIFIANLETSRY